METFIMELSLIRKRTAIIQKTDLSPINAIVSFYIDYFLEEAPEHVDEILKLIQFNSASGIYSFSVGRKTYYTSQLSTSSNPFIYGGAF